MDFVRVCEREREKKKRWTYRIDHTILERHVVFDHLVKRQASSLSHWNARVQVHRCKENVYVVERLIGKESGSGYVEGMCKH